MRIAIGVALFLLCMFFMRDGIDAPALFYWLVFVGYTAYQLGRGWDSDKEKGNRHGNQC